MSKSEQSYQSIEAYLSGEMSAEQRAAFELELSTNDELANEVQLHLELNEHFSNKKQRAFKSSITEMRDLIKDQSPVPASKRTNRFLYFIPAFLLLVVAVFWMQSAEFFEESPQQKITPAKNADDTDIKITDEVKANEEQVIPAQPTNEPGKTKSNKQLIEQLIPERERIQKQAQEAPAMPMASVDYSTNSQLENLMKGGFRAGSNPQLEVLEQPENMIISNDETVQLSFKGMLNATNIGDCTVFLFSNREEDYSKFQPLLTFTPTIKKQSDKVSISFQKSLQLNPGLFYYLIEENETEDLLFVGKFSLSTK